MSRSARISVGNIYGLPVKNVGWMYFQYLGTDASCLSGHVIEAYNYISIELSEVGVETLHESGVMFHAQCYIQVGVKRELFNFVKKGRLLTDVESLSFRNWLCDQVNTIPESCDKWEVWYVNGEKQKVEKSSELLQRSSPGMVYNPYAIQYMYSSGGIPKLYPLIC